MNTPSPGLKLAYLISQYPAISHTFIMQEILYLRKIGFDIRVASINNAHLSAEQQTPENLTEIANTYYIKNEGAVKTLMVCLKQLLISPIGMLKGIFFSLRLSGLDLKRAFYHLFYLAEAVLLGAWMKKIDAVHVHVHFANPASNVGMILTKIFPFTFSITVHGPDEFYDVTLHHLKKKIELARFICCIGYYAQSQLMRVSECKQWSKFEIVPLGVEPSYFSPKSFQENPHIWQILCVGRLVSSKGQQILIAAIEILIQRQLSVHLCLIGDGPDKKQLEQYVFEHNLQKNVQFTGALNHGAVKGYYEKADLFVLPSFAEGIPVSLMEAMSMEIPCISTFVNGIPELIRHQIDGLLAIPSNVEELADAIQLLIQNVELREKIGKAGRKRVLEKYDLQTNREYLGKIFINHLAHKDE